MMTVNVNMNILNKENGKLTRSKSSSKEVVVGGVPTNCRNLQFLRLQIFICYFIANTHAQSPQNFFVTLHMSHGTWHMSHGTRHMAQGNGTWHKAHGTRHMSHGKNAKILETYNLGSFKGKLPERQKGSFKLTELVGGVLVEPKI